MSPRSADAGIAAAEKELTMRQRAARHLRGIPARQNQTAIDRLYDELNALHIARIERGERAADCPQCGGALEIVTDGMVGRRYAQPFNVRGRELPIKWERAPFAACSECEFCLEIRR